MDKDEKAGRESGSRAENVTITDKSGSISSWVRDKAEDQR